MIGRKAGALRQLRQIQMQEVDCDPLVYANYPALAF
jgi:hypothetical protein